MSLVSHVGPYEASLRARYDAARVNLSAKREIAPTTRIVRTYRTPQEPKPVEVEKVKRASPTLPVDHDYDEPLVVFPTWKKIVLDVCDKHKITVGQIMSNQRAKHIVAARFEAFYRLSTETKFSLPKIGKLFGGKDHTTVLHGVRKYKQRNGLA